MNEKPIESLSLEGLASNRLPLDADFLKGIEAKTAQISDKHNRHGQPFYSARSVKTGKTD